MSRIGTWFASLGCAVFLAACHGPEPGPRSQFTADEAHAARTACTFKAGTLPGLSLERNAPLETQIPIDTILVVMMENRSFDHLLQGLATMQPDAELAPLDATNPDRDEMPVKRFHLTDLCFEDTAHEWDDVHAQWDNGQMDGFVKTNYTAYGKPADGTRAMGYYTDEDLPFIHALAANFALADHGFSSLLGPTFPNRAYSQAATSYGLVDGNLFSDPRMNVMDLLTNGKVDWHDYYEGYPSLGTFLESLTRNLDHTDPLDRFFVDAAAGTLTPVVFVDPELSNGTSANRDDLHPPGDVQLGDQFLEKVVRAAMSSPQWPHMAVFVTFDEHGGLYDHMAPPPACPPDDLAPMVGQNGAPGQFDRLGVRVPFIAISPYAKPHYVSHVVYDHTSILRFIEARFNLPSMTARDANADPLFDLFDFAHPALLQPPSLPSAVIDQTKLADCNSKFP